MEVSMAQTQNVHSSDEQLLTSPTPAYTGYADFRWFLTFVVLPDPVIEDYFEIKAAIRIEGTTGYVLESLQVHSTYGKITLIFPPLPQKEQSVDMSGAEDYRGKATSIVNNVDHLNNSIQITLSPPPPTGTRPTIRLNSTTIDQQWLIGARDILLVEPPSIEMESESGNA